VSTPVECARSLWDAFQREGVDGLRPLVSEDVEWRPWGNHGRPLIGFEQLAQWYRAQRTTAGGSTSTVYRWEAVGDCALASGSLRVFRAGGFLDVQPTWVFFFRDDRLERATCYVNREEALAAVEAYAAAA
jgi:ketosteroid isomerase-like protein